MAQLSPTRFRATDANNVPINGAGLFVYQTGTTTKQTLYSDAALTITRANPVVSASTGYWAQFYVATGVTLDIQARTTDDVGSALLWEALEVDSVGTEDTGTFSRDFGADGRLQAVGATGAVRMEFGPPTGDNIGGGAIVSGWAGTDLDTGDWLGPLDVTGNVSVGGTLTVTGTLSVTGESDFYQLLTSGAVPAAASFDITLSATYDSYVLVMQNVSGTSTTPIARFSFDNGSTYKSAAGDYVGSTKNIGGTTVGATSSSTDIALAPSGTILYSTYELYIFSAALKESSIGGIVTSVISGDANVSWPAGATNNKNYGKATNIRILTAAGTFSAGRYALFGVPGL